MTDVSPEQIEAVIAELMTVFDVDQPPVPIELMLERPREGLWPRADLTELTSSFLVMTDRYSPRMSVARLLARHIARSDWGQARAIAPVVSSKNLINRFARALVMPQAMLTQALESGLSVRALTDRFEVPENDFTARLVDLGLERPPT